MNQWVNSKTDRDQFTPLHFASFKCNLDACLHLLLAGANKDALNVYGLNMVHVAAQGDSAATLYLFWQLGVPISEKDKRGSTPLHWACYSQSEVALSYLLAWKPDLNA
jgi:ankyrin repeat protein